MVLLRLISGRRSEEREGAFSQYMEVIAPLEAVEKSVSGICMRWSTSDVMGHSACSKKLNHRVLKVEEWYGPQSSSSMIVSEYNVR